MNYRTSQTSLMNMRYSVLGWGTVVLMVWLTSGLYMMIKDWLLLQIVSSPIRLPGPFYPWIWSVLIHHQTTVDMRKPFLFRVILFLSLNIDKGGISVADLNIFCKFFATKMDVFTGLYFFRRDLQFWKPRPNKGLDINLSHSATF